MITWKMNHRNEIIVKLFNSLNVIQTLFYLKKVI